MRKFIILFSILSFSSISNSIENVWVEFEDSYVLSIQSGEYKKALNSAFELNKIDPSDTQSLLRIVLASVKSGTKLPSWVMSNPWPNATKQDILNRLLAEQLVNGALPTEDFHLISL